MYALSFSPRKQQTPLTPWRPTAKNAETLVITLISGNKFTLKWTFYRICPVISRSCWYTDATGRRPETEIHSCVYSHQHQDGGKSSLDGTHGLQLLQRTNQEHDAEGRKGNVYKTEAEMVEVKIRFRKWKWTSTVLLSDYKLLISVHFLNLSWVFWS